MKTILLIGLGRFGRHVAIHLNRLGHQIMAVDTQEERIEAVLPYVTNAQIGDSTNASFLESLGIRNFDVCIVAIGDSFQSSLETTSLLKEMGGKRENTVYVGDSEVDIQTARNCGMDYIGVSWGFRGREKLLSIDPKATVVDRAEEILKIIR